LRHYVEKLSPLAEFAVVILGAFGFFFVMYLQAVIWPGAPWRIGYGGFKGLMAYEVVVFAVLIGFLHVRGWTLDRLGFGGGMKDTLIGLALVLAVYVACAAIYWTILAAWPPAEQVMNPYEFSHHSSLPTVIAISIVNPIFEETFVCGYVMSALKKRTGVWNAISISVAIRLLYHLYQGAAAFITIVPFGVILAYWFARTGRLWPVIVAHIIADFTALTGHVV